MKQISLPRFRLGAPCKLAVAAWVAAEQSSPVAVWALLVDHIELSLGGLVK